MSFVILALALYMYPSPIDPKPFRFPSPIPKLTGPLEVNQLLQRTKRAFEGSIVGPESFAIDGNGTVYTGTADGKVVAIRNGQLTLVVLSVHTKNKVPLLGSYDYEPLCGRPKGMKVGPDGHLYLVDSYKGLFRINLQNKALETLIPSNIGVNNVPFKFLNGLDISSQGIVYFTDSSLTWDRRNFRYEVLETHNEGRLLQYNISSGQSKCLLSDLYLANGVALAPEEHMLLISEMSVSRIRRYFLTGEKAGTSDVLIDNLPGYPDNIKLNSRGNFYIGMGSVRFQGSSPIGPFLDLVGPYPILKRAIAKITPFVFYNLFLPKHALVIEINTSGDLVGSMHDPCAKVIGAVSEAFETNDTIYIGHFQSTYVGVLEKSSISNTF
ncbi:hypothetical protein ACJMK2_017340 [Sinanodonta woodiana]|uniref:Strictosidine synthase conserved region domain-containing protein n=1 Tax=Sinanodonta woodiana TaxID=1069815 RepID=A0ABD3UWK2_SINWO